MLSPEEIQEMILDLDTPFQFKCRSCGKCWLDTAVYHLGQTPNCPLSPCEIAIDPIHKQQ